MPVCSKCLIFSDKFLENISLRVHSIYTVCLFRSLYTGRLVRLQGCTCCKPSVSQPCSLLVNASRMPQCRNCSNRTSVKTDYFVSSSTLAPATKKKKKKKVFVEFHLLSSQNRIIVNYETLITIVPTIFLIHEKFTII